MFISLHDGKNSLHFTKYNFSHAIHLNESGCLITDHPDFVEFSQSRVLTVDECAFDASCQKDIVGVFDPGLSKIIFRCPDAGQIAFRMGLLMADDPSVLIDQVFADDGVATIQIDTLAGVNTADLVDGKRIIGLGVGFQSAPVTEVPFLGKVLF